MKNHYIYQFIIDLVRIGIHPKQQTQPSGWACPVSHLIDMIMLKGLEKIAEDIASDPCKEIRLNGAGLKLYTRSYKCIITVSIGGDQANQYPDFVDAARKLISTYEIN